MSQYNNQQKQSGFTIIELTIAMGFVSVLLIAIAMLIMQISGIYNRGITLKQVNQAGRAISYELQDSITTATPFSLAKGAVGEKVSYVNQTWGGALCLGNYSYVWNNGSAIRTASDPTYSYVNLNKYTGAYSGVMPDNKIIRFVKINDPDSKYCVPQDIKSTIPAIDLTKATELLSVGQNNLVIHKLTITTSTSAATTGQQLYDIVFSIGTNDINSLETEGVVATKCKPPGLSADPTYCSVEEFHLVARAGNAK